MSRNVPGQIVRKVKHVIVSKGFEVKTVECKDKLKTHSQG